MSSFVARHLRSATALTLCAAVVAGGCTKIKGKPASQAPAPTLAAAPSVLGPGDELEIKFYYAPELNTQQRIRPDGNVSMQLIGDVHAAGMTPTQLNQQLTQAYSQHLRFPEVSVIVRGMYSRRIFVTGEVLKPGQIDMVSDKLSLYEAIASCGGFALTTANLKQVIVAREQPDGSRQGYIVDMRDEMGGGLTHPFMLQPTDIVIVPRTGVVEVNQWIQQYINNNVPGGSYFYSRSVGDGSITFSPNSH